MPREELIGSVIGPKGDKGDMIFWLEVDTDGDLYAVYADGSSPPVFEYNSANGNLYLIVND